MWETLTASQIVARRTIVALLMFLRTRVLWQVRGRVPTE